MRLVTLSGSHNQHLNLRRVTELPRLQLVCARVKDFFSRSGCEGAVATRSSCGAVVMTRIIKGEARTRRSVASRRRANSCLIASPRRWRRQFVGSFREAIR